MNEGRREGRNDDGVRKNCMSCVLCDLIYVKSSLETCYFSFAHFSLPKKVSNESTHTCIYIHTGNYWLPPSFFYVCIFVPLSHFFTRCSHLHTSPKIRVSSSPKPQTTQPKDTHRTSEKQREGKDDGKT